MYGQSCANSVSTHSMMLSIICWIVSQEMYALSDFLIMVFVMVSEAVT